MKKKIIWRLANRPTPAELVDLTNAGLLNKDEAREILLTEETEEKVSEDSLKSEIKFLRELVDKLSNGSQSKIVETIRYIDRPYYRYPWYQPYASWCGTGNSIVTGVGATLTGAATSLNAAAGVNLSAVGTGSISGSAGFSKISTF